MIHDNRTAIESILKSWRRATTGISGPLVGAMDGMYHDERLQLLTRVFTRLANDVERAVALERIAASN